MSKPKLRGGVYWIDAQINGTRIRESLKTDDLKQAQHLYDLRKAELWSGKVLKAKPKYMFDQACERWLDLKAHKRSIADDRLKIAYFLKLYKGKLLADLTRDQIEADLPRDVKPSTRNRYRALMRAMLRAAEREWEWIDRAPVLIAEPEPEGRVAYMSREQAEVLIACLPDKYRNPVRLALLTGLRRSNIFDMLWENIDLERGTAVVRAEDAKGKRRIIVPLNSQARALLEALPGPRQGRVWGDLKRVWCNTWKAAVKRAELPAGFRFHDLRHTWASWHAMAGTRREVIQELGGWASGDMVQRYAHLSPAFLGDAAERVGF